MREIQAGDTRGRGRDAQREREQGIINKIPIYRAFERKKGGKSMRCAVVSLLRDARVARGKRVVVWFDRQSFHTLHSCTVVQLYRAYPP